MSLTSSDGIPITIRPIQPNELDQIPLRCWPEDREVLMRLFEAQGTIGMAAWEGDKCVAQLHCYRVILPDQDNADWPVWNHWWNPTWWLQADYTAGLPMSGPAWCHACCHVGRTLESFQEEQSYGETEAAPGIRKGTDPRYFGRGIGTALCKTSLRWAWEHDYAMVFALGAPKGLFEVAVLAGHLPWTTYTKLGFDSVNILGGSAELPAWARGHGPSEVASEVQAALAAGRPIEEFYERLMVLNLRSW